MAVSGVDGWKFLDLSARLEEELELNIDLIPLDDNSKLSKHGSTFGGNPLACAAGIASIDFMVENKLWEQAEAKGKYFREKLEKHSLFKVREIRQIGLMIGIELKDKVQPVILELLSKGIISLPAGTTVLRMLPPLVISYEDLDKVIEMLVEVLQ